MSALAFDVREMRDLLVRRLTAVLGEQAVLFAPDRIEEETRTCIPFRQHPECVVYPSSTEQVREVVEVARSLGVPIWPVSTGKNWGYGEKSASYPGGITMVLERMKKIEIVDAELGYAVIEPGVTYHDLNAFLKERRLPLWSDSTGSTEAASVIGNALDKGRGLTPYADHFGALCGLEVVLSDGSLLRTGNVTEVPNHVWHLYKWGVGPYLDGLFVQSNLGIVVKAGIWLMPAPEAFDFLAFDYTTSPERFGEMIDDLRRLVFAGALPSRPHVANDFAMLCIVSQYPKHRLAGGKRLDQEALAAWRKEHGVGAWTFGCGLYGSRAQVQNQRKALRRTLGRYGRLWSFGRMTESGWWSRKLFRLARWGARLAGKSDAYLTQITPAANLFRGIPTDDFAKQVYFKSHDAKPGGAIDAPKDGCGFIWLGPIVPFRSENVNEVLERAKKTFAKHEFDFFVEVIVESARAVIVLFGVFYERTDAADAKRASDWYTELREEMIDAGYPPYRETVSTSPHVFDKNTTTRTLLSKLKDALDPERTLAPGRYGIQ